VHCVNNSASAHATGATDKSERSNAVHRKDTVAQDTPGVVEHMEMEPHYSEGEDVLQLHHFMVPSEVAAALEPFLLGDEHANPTQVIQKLICDGVLDEESVDVAYEALLTCVNLGLLVVEDVDMT
jgi:hypothetical protein